MYRPWMLNQNVPLTRDLFIRNVEPDPWLPLGSWVLRLSWADGRHLIYQTQRHMSHQMLQKYPVTLWQMGSDTQTELILQNFKQCRAMPSISSDQASAFCEDHFRIVVTRSEQSRVHTSAGCADHLLISRVWRPPDTRGAGHTDVKIPGNHNTQHNLHWSRVTGWMDWLLFIAATVNTILHIPWTPGNIPIDSFSFSRFQNTWPLSQQRTKISSDLNLIFLNLNESF